MTTDGGAGSGLAYALVFRYRVPVFGQGGSFAALVIARGRLLLLEENGTWFVSGVAPGGISAHGPTPAEALESFRETFSRVMFECASDPEGFRSFEASVKEFFDQVDDEDLVQWQASAQAVRAGAGAPMELPRVRADSPDGQADVAVVRLNEPGIRVENATDTMAIAQLADVA